MATTASVQIQNGVVTNFTTSRQSDPSWYQVTFPQAFSGSGEIVVTAQIQTYNGMDTPGLRIQNVDATGFQVRMNELVGNDVSSSAAGDLGKIQTNDGHPNAETLGWIAYQ